MLTPYAVSLLIMHSTPQSNHNPMRFTRFDLSRSKWRLNWFSPCDLHRGVLNMRFEVFLQLWIWHYFCLNRELLAQIQRLDLLIQIPLKPLFIPLYRALIAKLRRRVLITHIRPFNNLIKALLRLQKVRPLVRVLSQQQPQKSTKMLFIWKLLQYIIQFPHFNHILRPIQLIISLQTSHLQKYQP